MALKLKEAETKSRVELCLNILEKLNPISILKKGYSIIKGNVEIGQQIDIETIDYNIEAKVLEIKKK